MSRFATLILICRTIANSLILLTFTRSTSHNKIYVYSQWHYSLAISHIPGVVGRKSYLGSSRRRADRSTLWDKVLCFVELVAGVVCSCVAGCTNPLCCLGARSTLLGCIRPVDRPHMSCACRIALGLIRRLGSRKHLLYSADIYRNAARLASASKSLWPRLSVML